MRNFHLPLPEKTYDRLRLEAERSDVPATALAREAIGFWLDERRKRVLRESIAAYASRMAGTKFDLDPQLEAAGVQHLTGDTEERG